MAAANDHLTNPRTMEGGESQRTKSDVRGKKTQQKKAHISQLQLKTNELGAKFEKKFDCVANALFVRLE